MELNDNVGVSDWRPYRLSLPPARVTPGLKTMRLLIASSARRSSPFHAERCKDPSTTLPYFYALYAQLNSYLKLTVTLLSCLHGSTTVETVATSTATAVQATSWPCPLTPDRCECATCVTHSCCREARPRRPDKATQHCSHSSCSLFFLNLNYQQGAT